MPHEGRDGRRSGDGEGRISQAFGVPGAAINPLYAALRERGTIGHVLARHVERASHMAEGYTRRGGQHRRASAPRAGRHRHGHRSVLGAGRLDPDPLHHRPGAAGPHAQGRLPGGRHHRHPSSPVTKWATTVLEPAQVPRAFQQAFHLMRSGRPGPVLIDLPFDVQMAEIEFDIDTYEPLPVYKPRANRAQIEKALSDAAGRGAAGDRFRRRRHQCRRVRPVAVRRDRRACR